MLRKCMVVALAFLLASLLASSKAQAWGGYHVGYTHVGYGGVYHAGYTRVGGYDRYGGFDRYGGYRYGGYRYGYGGYRRYY